MCAQTRPFDQGCLNRRLAFVLPSTASLHSHRVPADKLSTQPATLNQGCLYYRLAFVLPWTVFSYSHWVPADKLSTQPVLWIKGVGAADQSWCSPIACHDALSTRCLQTRPGPGVSARQTILGASAHQVLLDKGVCAADQPWGSPLPASSHSN